MKLGIIGAGNMGGAILRGLINSGVIAENEVIVASPDNHGELNEFKRQFPALNVSKKNIDAATAEYIIIAVKPWIVEKAINDILPHFDYTRSTIISIVAGITCNEIAQMAGPGTKVVRVIPNTAIAVGESMTFVASDNPEADTEAVAKMFSPLGSTMIISENNMSAATALASCGIAYALRYIRAASEGGVELGFRADEAKKIVMQTLKGAVAVLEASGNNPEIEIDKVTTPGGITIKGLNAMEHYGFSNSVIEGLKASR